MEYMVTDYRENDLVRMDILIAGEVAPPLAAIVHKDIAASMGKGMTRKLKELIPRQQFKVSIQAAIGQKIVASSQISPIRKDVLAKCYGGLSAARTHTGVSWVGAGRSSSAHPSRPGALPRALQAATSRARRSCCRSRPRARRG
jgi:hypothetical protein